MEYEIKSILMLDNGDGTTTITNTIVLAGEVLQSQSLIPYSITEFAMTLGTEFLDGCVERFEGKAQPVVIPNQVDFE